MKRPILLLLVLMAAIGWAPIAPAPVRAQDAPPITLQVQAGYEGAYRSGEWFPVLVDIANDGPDARGVLEWHFPGQREDPAFRRAIDLPRGARKRIALQAFSRGFARSGQVQFLDGDTLLAAQDVNLEPIDQGRLLIGVISSDPALLNSLGVLQVFGGTSALVRHLRPEALPEQAALLRTLNVLFLHDLDTSALAPAQRAALELWVRLGGQLVLSGGIGGRSAAGLAELLPVEIDEERAEGDLAPLARLAGIDDPPQAAPIVVGRPRAGAEALPSDTPLLFRRGVGAGTVIFSAFDFASLRGWPGEPALWERVLVPRAIFAPGTSARLRQHNFLADVLRLPSLSLPPASALLCFLVVYILAIGPLNYLVLRRLRRLEWAWLTVPIAVLLFSGGLYVAGLGLRGGQSQLHQVAVVQGTEGQQRGFATAFIGLFSPRRSTYTLSFTPETLVSEAHDGSDSFSPLASVLSGDAGVEVSNVLVDIGSMRTFMAETEVAVTLSIQSNLRLENGRVLGEIHNTSAQTLGDALVIYGSAFQQLGSVAPGASRPVALDQVGRFPWAVDLPRSESYDRQQLLSALFADNNVRFGSPTPSQQRPFDDSGVYLLAWQEQPIVTARVNGQEPPPSGLTLYIIRLGQ